MGLTMRNVTAACTNLWWMMWPVQLGHRMIVFLKVCTKFHGSGFESLLTGLDWCCDKVCLTNYELVTKSIRADRLVLKTSVKDWDSSRHAWLRERDIKLAFDSLESKDGTWWKSIQLTYMKLIRMWAAFNGASWLYLIQALVNKSIVSSNGTSKL